VCGVRPSAWVQRTVSPAWTVMEPSTKALPLIVMSHVTGSRFGGGLDGLVVLDVLGLLELEDVGLLDAGLLDDVRVLEVLGLVDDALWPEELLLDDVPVPVEEVGSCVPVGSSGPSAGSLAGSPHPDKASRRSSRTAGQRMHTPICPGRG